MCELQRYFKTGLCEVEVYGGLIHMQHMPCLKMIASK